MTQIKRTQIKRTAEISVIFLTSLMACCCAWAADEAPRDVKFDGFVDGYYAYDFNGPPNFDRAFTTQPARSDEFNINLAYIGATLTEKKVRARFALQAGTSVQNNYAGEPTNGAVSGPTLARSIQEAYVGYRITDDLWLDGGIYFSHVGAEGFVSRDNLTYTRSLVADFSPYYQSGLRLSYKASDALQIQLHVINGWQVISENNHSKTLGTQVTYAISSRLNFSYNTLIGRESEFRHFHDLILKYEPSDEWSCVFQYDVGFQKQFGGSGFDSWSGFTLMAKYKLTSSKALSVRVEQYQDPHQVIVSTSTPNGFQVRSASLGYDVLLSQTVSWRTEFRNYWSMDSVYPSRDGASSVDGLGVTSISASF